MARQIPHNLEAEQSVLGSMLISRQSVIEAIEYPLYDFDFYLESHRIIFNAMLELNRKEMPIDITTVTVQLQDTNLLNKANGVDYLASLAQSVPSTSNIKYYIKIISEKSLARRLIETANKIAEDSYDQIDDFDNLIQNAEKNILQVTQNRKVESFQTINQVVNDVINNLDKLSRSGGSITGNGITSGFVDIDRLILGFQKGDLIILAARPSVGKTAFALNIAQKVAEKTNETVAIFSLEMPSSSLVQRMLSMVGKLNSEKFRRGNLLQQEWTKLYEAVDRMRSCNIFIDDSPGIKMNEIFSKCRRLKTEHGLGLIVIDYLQLISGSGNRSGENRQQEVSEISRRLKALAREMEVPVIALSQLSRNVERREDKRPMMSDLRESGSIEQDADIIAFLHRDDYYNRDEDNEKKGEVELIVAKNRNGGTGTVELLFEKEYSSFYNKSKI